MLQQPQCNLQIVMDDPRLPKKQKTQPAEDTVDILSSIGASISQTVKAKIEQYAVGYNTLY
jgi:hypothetical protein